MLLKLSYCITLYEWTNDFVKNNESQLSDNDKVRQYRLNPEVSQTYFFVMSNDYSHLVLSFHCRPHESDLLDSDNKYANKVENWSKLEQTTVF